jgi:hypothetical protein
MRHAKAYAKFLVGLLVPAGCGCAEAFLGLGSLFDSIGGGLNTIGTCLSPLAPIDLNAVFSSVEQISWLDDSAEITDAPQPEVQAFFREQLGQDVVPADYLTMRFYGLGPLSGGNVVELEPLSERISHVYLYDSDFALIPAGATRDFDGRRRILQVPIPRDSSAVDLRLDLAFLSETGESIARLTRRNDVAPLTPRSQTVVLHFSGQTEILFRSGWLLPTAIGPIDDGAARQAAVEEFRALYAPFHLTVLTDEDPPPDGPFSIIYIGPAEPPFDYYGFAETVDVGNVYQDDVAVVDANRPAIAMARLLGPDVYGRALGGIAAHEMGHLLGLYHVSDPDALMTGAQCQGAGLDIERMLRRQLREAPVTAAVAGLQEWVIGYQEPADYLLAVLGPAGPP